MIVGIWIPNAGMKAGSTGFSPGRVLIDVDNLKAVRCAKCAVVAITMTQLSSETTVLDANQGEYYLVYESGTNLTFEKEIIKSPI